MVGKTLGGRIRVIRLRRGMTLATLALEAGLTKGYISLVERGHKIPTIASLVKLASTLEIDVTALFEEEPPQEPVAIVRKQDRKPFDGPLSHRDYHYESVTYKTPERHLEAFVMTPPKNDKGSEQLYDHVGEEMVFVLSGKVELILSDRRYGLRKGDCCYFDSSIPHTYRSCSRTPARCLTVIYPVQRK